MRSIRRFRRFQLERGPVRRKTERPRTIPALLAARQPKPRKLPTMREAGTPAEND